jgi:hypothetical protein
VLEISGRMGVTSSMLSFVQKTSFASAAGRNNTKSGKMSVNLNTKLF